LRTVLTELNEDLVEQARVRLRVGLHEGVVHRAPHGYVGPAVIELPRGVCELSGTLSSEAVISIPRYGVFSTSKAKPTKPPAPFRLPLGPAG
jgi:hypothetical protein